MRGTTGLQIPLVRNRKVQQLPRQLSIAKLDEWFHTAYGYELHGHGFQQVGRRRWVRSSKVPIREGIQILSLKDYSFAPVWFASIDLVPHLTETGRVRWHGSAKNARPDLCVDPLDAPDRYDLDRLVVSGRSTPGEAKDAIKTGTRYTVRCALEWFAQIGDLPSLIALYDEARSRPTFGAGLYSQRRLSYAFVLRATGYEALAEQEFAHWVEECGPSTPSETIRDLRSSLLSVPRPRAG